MKFLICASLVAIVCSPALACDSTQASNSARTALVQLSKQLPQGSVVSFGVSLQSMAVQAPFKFPFAISEPGVQEAGIVSVDSQTCVAEIEGFGTIIPLQ